MQIDWKRAEVVLDRVHLALRTGQYPFDNMQVVQRAENLPASLEGPKDQSLHLFRAKEWMQGGALSEDSMRKLKVLHEGWPELFPAEEAMKLSEAAIRDAIIRAGLTHYETRPDWWLYNSKILLRYWGGDPRNIFQGLPLAPRETWAEICNRMLFHGRGNGIGFIGTQEKIASITAHFHVDARLVPYFFCPPAFDLHQCRGFLGTEIIKAGRKIGGGKDLKEIRDAGREIYTWYCLEKDVCPYVLGEGLWIFSGEMCRYAPGNMSENGVYTGREAAQSPNAGHRPRGRWKSYSETCGKCFLSDLCRWCIPQVFHYSRAGGLRLFPRARLENEQPFVLDPDLPDVVRCDKHRRLWDPRVEGVCTGCGYCEEG